LLLYSLLEEHKAFTVLEKLVGVRRARHWSWLWPWLRGSPSAHGCPAGCSLVFAGLRGRSGRGRHRRGCGLSGVNGIRGRCVSGFSRRVQRGSNL